MTKVAITGAAGRMGKTLLEAVHQTDGVSVCTAIERAGSSVIGVDAGELAGIGRLDVPVIEGIDAAPEFDVLIDFTRPEVTMANLAVCKQRGSAIVIGTTGFDESQKAEIEAASQEIGIVFAPPLLLPLSLPVPLSAPLPLPFQLPLPLARVRHCHRHCKCHGRFHCLHTCHCHGSSALPV